MGHGANPTIPSSSGWSRRRRCSASRLCGEAAGDLGARGGLVGACLPRSRRSISGRTQTGGLRRAKPIARRAACCSRVQFAGDALNAVAGSRGSSVCCEISRRSDGVKRREVDVVRAKKFSLFESVHAVRRKTKKGYTKISVPCTLPRYTVYLGEEASSLWTRLEAERKRFRKKMYAVWQSYSVRRELRHGSIKQFGLLIRRKSSFWCTFPSKSASRKRKMVARGCVCKLARFE